MMISRILSTIAITAAMTFTAQAQGNTAMTVGQDAPELSYNTPNDQAMSLKEVNKGRYILLDFWASWCRPCRMASPRLVALYDKYKDQKFRDAPNGFTVFSVSLDRSKEAWIKAIGDDKLSWEYHISDLGSWDSEAAAKYGVQFIPQAFLLGPDGKIVAKYDFAEQAAADLEKYLDKGATAPKAVPRKAKTAGKKKR